MRGTRFLADGRFYYYFYFYFMTKVKAVCDARKQVYA